MAAACTLTPAAAALPPLLPTPLFVAGCASKKPGRASASESWTRDKLIGRTSIPGRASLSESWTKDKAERKEKETETTTRVERVGRLVSREEGQVGAKRAPSRAPSVEVDRSEKKAKPEEESVEPVAALELYAGPAFVKSPEPSEVPLPKFPLFVKSPDPSELPMPRFLNLKAPKAA